MDHTGRCFCSCSNSVLFSCKLVLWALYAKEVTGPEEPEIHAIFERLVKSAGIPKPKLAIGENHIPFALSTGRSQKHSFVVVSRGLIKSLDKTELESVIAHEMYHIKTGDSTAITFASFLHLIMYLLMRSLFGIFVSGDSVVADRPAYKSSGSVYIGLGSSGASGTGEFSSGGAGIATIILLLLNAVGHPFYLLARLPSLIICRYREYNADKGSALITAQPSPSASALLRISNYIATAANHDLKQLSAVSHMTIVGTNKRRGISKFLLTHPPVEKRIERLQMLQRQLEGR